MIQDDYGQLKEITPRNVILMALEHSPGLTAQELEDYAKNIGISRKAFYTALHRAHFVDKEILNEFKVTEGGKGKKGGRYFLPKNQWQLRTVSETPTNLDSFIADELKRAISFYITSPLNVKSIDESMLAEDLDKKSREIIASALGFKLDSYDEETSRIKLEGKMEVAEAYLNRCEHLFQLILGLESLRGKRFNRPWGNDLNVESGAMGGRGPVYIRLKDPNTGKAILTRVSMKGGPPRPYWAEWISFFMGVIDQIDNKQPIIVRKKGKRK
jgi:hypothetical protein